MKYLKATCSVSWCGRTHEAKGLCKPHYARKLAGRDLEAPFQTHKQRPRRECGHSGCAAIHYAKGFCERHYHRNNDGVDMDKRVRGGALTNKEGYTTVWDRELQKSVFMHVLVMENMLGRKLLPNETVHHKNTIRDDNAPSNLELWDGSQPPGGRVEDKLEWARAFVARYENQTH